MSIAKIVSFCLDLLLNKILIKSYIHLKISSKLNILLHVVQCSLSAALKFGMTGIEHFYSNDHVTCSQAVKLCPTKKQNTKTKLVSCINLFLCFLMSVQNKEAGRLEFQSPSQCDQKKIAKCL